ncbi:hypothetical protein [Pseudalkalibacillus salsuginis]|uniref:hypothetical protein n=1 Tax=Pseudalkalibacillus salsuginis TaxID=2910972 RepID=UPI001F46E985|nr:hypothetical protein [Pseudalkalibacillus salsuginis]MCF6409087.1 hypothetical protein [Pseudalkalibacillus salsuginis]
MKWLDDERWNELLNNPENAIEKRVKTIPYMSIENQAKCKYRFEENIFLLKNDQVLSTKDCF